MCGGKSHHMSYMCEKEFLDSNFELMNYWQNIDLSGNLPQILHIYKSLFFNYNCNFLDQLLLPCKFLGSSMRGILFFNFAICEPLKKEIITDPETINIHTHL